MCLQDEKIPESHTITARPNIGQEDPTLLLRIAKIGLASIYV